MDSSDSNSSFGFAFNNVRFSDRLLRIEITNGGEIINVSSVQDRKRRRTDVNTRGGENEKECNPNQAPRVRELHISSPILAAKSPFFFKLFSNGMIESEQKHITMRIEADEEAAVMELLNFMYTNSLSSVTVPALFRVLMAADKFEVASCMKYCTRLLLNVPMTLPYALFILRHPCPLLLADSVKPLTNAARHFLALHYKDVTKFPTEELKALPLVGVTTLLMSNDLMIASEDTVYEVVLEWAKANYSVLEERQVILSRLARYIRFPYMTCPRLKKILTSDDFEPSVAYKLVLEALFFKAEPSLDQGLIQRAYTCRPIKTVEFEVPHRQSIVYLDLTRQECNALYPSNRIYSQEFQLGGQEFFLSACCNKNQLNGFHCFGLFLRAQLKGSVSMTVAYNFSARRKPTHEFVLRSRGKYKFTRGVESIGFKDLFGTSWASFTREDCFYFINDVLHLRAEISISP